MKKICLTRDILEIRESIMNVGSVRVGDKANIAISVKKLVSILEPIISWCDENNIAYHIEEYRYHPTVSEWIIIENEEDIMAFKLRWL